MTEFFEGSDMNDLIQRVLAYIKTTIENPNYSLAGHTIVL